MSDEDGKLTFLEHLEEARRRIIVSFVAIGFCTIVGFLFSKEILYILVTRPFEKIDVTPVTLSVTEPITVQFKVAFYAGLTLAMPVLVYEAWLFVAPGLYANERRAIRPIFWSMILLFACGASFSYGVVIPVGLPILKHFADVMGLKAMWSLGSCANFSVLLVLGFGISFQLPLVIAILARLGVVDHQMLSKNRRIAVVAIVVISAVLTPTTDGLTMFLMAGPLWILFEASVLAARFLGQPEKGEVADRADSIAG